MKALRRYRERVSTRSAGFGIERNARAAQVSPKRNVYRFAAHDACRRLLLMTPEEQQQHKLLMLLHQQIAVQQHLQLPAIPKEQQHQLHQKLQSLQQQQMQLMESPPQQMLIPLLQCIHAPDEETRAAFIEFACALAASKEGRVCGVSEALYCDFDTSYRLIHSRVLHP